jgi:anti-sigma factor RsiW
MTCEEFVPFMDAYVDHELDDQDIREVEMHLESCSRCKESVNYQIAYKEGIKRHLAIRAPESLESKMWSFIEEQHALDAEAEVAEESNVVALEPKKKRSLGWILAPIAAAFVAVLMVPNLTVSPASSTTTPVIEQTLEWHRGNYPIEVAGPDAHEVAGWFGDKVDFPMTLPDLGPQSTILGARIAHVQDRRAALVVYEVDGKRVSVLIFDGSDLTVPSEFVKRVNERDMVLMNQNGYELAVIQHDGVTYSVAGDLPESRFVNLVSQSFH